MIMENTERCTDQYAALEEPLSIYEVHPASWMRVPEEGGRPLTCAELAPKLADYARRMNFTHVELKCAADSPICGTAHDLLEFIDHLHEYNVRVLVDRRAPDLPSATPATDPSERGLAGTHADGFRAGGSSPCAMAMTTSR